MPDATPRASPSARRSPSATWRDPRLIVGVVIVAASVLAGARIFENADDTVTVWAARGDLAAGAPVGRRDLAQLSVRFAAAADADRYLSAAADVPAGARLLRPVGAGELLPRSALGRADSEPITEVPLSVPSDGIPDSVQQGSIVDVWVTPDMTAEEPAGQSVVVFEEVLVVAAPATGSSLAPTGTRQLIIAVPRSEDHQLAAALARASRGTTIVTKQG